MKPRALTCGGLKTGQSDRAQTRLDAGVAEGRTGDAPARVHDRFGPRLTALAHRARVGYRIRVTKGCPHA